MMKPESRLEYKLEYNSYILCYVDDIFCIHHDPYDVLNKLNGYVPLKPGSVRIPMMYLCTKLKYMQLHNHIWAKSMHPSKNVQEAVRICEEYIAKHLSKGYILLRRAENPFICGYCLELNMSPVLGHHEASYYQSLIGEMRWMAKIARCHAVINPHT